MSDRYAIRYVVDLKPEGWAKEDLGEDGGTDAIIIHSIIFPDDGSRSEMVLTLDGRTGEDLSDAEIFKSWVWLARSLMDAPGLNAAAQAKARRVFKEVQAEILAARGIA